MNPPPTAHLAFYALHADLVQRVNAMGDTPELRELRDLLQNDLPLAVHRVAVETEGRTVAAIKQLTEQIAQEELESAVAHL